MAITEQKAPTEYVLTVFSVGRSEVIGTFTDEQAGLIEAEKYADMPGCFGYDLLPPDAMYPLGNIFPREEYRWQSRQPRSR